MDKDAQAPPASIASGQVDEPDKSISSSDNHVRFVNNTSSSSAAPSASANGLADPAVAGDSSVIVTAATPGLGPGSQGLGLMQQPTAAATTTAAAAAGEGGHATSTAGHEPGPSHDFQQPQPPLPHFVAPLSYLRPKPVQRSAMAAAPPQSARPSPLDKEQRQGLVRVACARALGSTRCIRRRAELLTCCLCLQKAVRDFLRVRTSYDVLPLSYRLVVLDTDLLIKKSLNILIQNGESPAHGVVIGLQAGLSQEVG